VSVTNSFSMAARPMVGARYRFRRRDALEASYSYSPNRFSIQPAGQAALSAYNRADLISFNYVHYFFPPQGRTQPFATAGVGVNRFSGPSNAPAVTAGYTNADNGWKLAWNFGFGGDLVLTRYAVFRFELRDYFTGLPPVITGTGHSIAGTSQGVVPSVGIVFRFK
jgi:opacity protein-like surface antigen